MGISVSEELALSIMSLHSTFSVDSKEGGSRWLCNSGICLSDYTASHPRRQ